MQLDKHFGSSAKDTYLQHLLSVKQEGWFTEFRSEFLRLAAFPQDLPMYFVENAYIKGLKQEILLEISLAKPSGIIEVMKLSLQAANPFTAMAHAFGVTSPLTIKNQLITHISLFHKKILSNNHFQGELADRSKQAGIPGSYQHNGRETLAKSCASPRSPEKTVMPYCSRIHYEKR